MHDPGREGSAGSHKGFQEVEEARQLLSSCASKLTAVTKPFPTGTSPTFLVNPTVRKEED